MAIAVLLILLVGIVLFVTEIFPLPVTAMSMCVAFYLTGAVDASKALSAFSSSTAFIIVCMAIIGEAVFKTGGAAKIARILTKFADNERKLIFVTILFSGLMSGFLSNTGAAGLLIALILGISLSTGMKRSKLMYPVIVGCCFGGGISIVGTTSGPFLKEALEGLGTGLTFSFFEWAPLSIILLLTSAVYMSTIGYGLLPDVPNNEGEYDAADVSVGDYSSIPAWKTWLSIAVMFLTLVGMIFEEQIGIKLHFMAIIGAIIVVGSGCLTVKEASRAIPTSGLIIYAALVPVATAMTNSGAAELIAGAAQSLFSSVGSPLLIVVLVFLFVTPLTQFMSNAATIILLTPIALLISEALGINPKAMLTAIRFAASIAIATPVAMPANSMAVEPGGYRFMDYVRPGLPLTLICVAISIAYIAIFYPLNMY